jgi:hypothetical protein
LYQYRKNGCYPNEEGAMMKRKIVHRVANTKTAKQIKALDKSFFFIRHRQYVKPSHCASTAVMLVESDVIRGLFGVLF